MSDRSHPFSRREFIAGTAATAAALALGNAPQGRAAEAAVAARKVKLGVVGCGGRGAWIAGLFRDHGGYECMPWPITSSRWPMRRVTRWASISRAVSAACPAIAA